MMVQCSGCHVVMGRNDGDETKASHSICRKCWAKLYPGMPVFPEVEAEWRTLEGPDERKTVV
jgi:hypothetical protein